MKLKKDDLVILRPHRMNTFLQPFKVEKIGERQVILISTKGNYRRFCRPKSPHIFPYDPNVPVEAQLLKLKAKINSNDKTWRRLKIGQYYQVYKPSRLGHFCYYKITDKWMTGSNERNMRYHIKYRRKWDRNEIIVTGELDTYNPKTKIWGRNYKPLPKLQGLLKLGE